MKARIFFLVGCIAVATQFLVSCSDATEEQRTVSIVDVGYVAITYPSDYWADSSEIKPSLGYDFAIVFTGNVVASDIAYARIYLPGGSRSYWDFDPTRNLDIGAGLFSGSPFWYGANQKELPIGTMKAEIKLTNGVISSSEFTMGIPGSTTPGAYSYTYSAQDEVASYPSASMPALRRPTLTAFSGGVSSPLSISFTINGDHVHNGWAWFYDGDGRYVGGFFYFVDWNSGAPSSRLGGYEFNDSDGESNTLTVNASDIEDSTGTIISSATFASIRSCRIVVCDGYQYAGPGAYARYDYRAISENLSF